MTTHVVADDVLGQIARRRWDLERRLMEGSIDPSYVLAGLQEISENKFVLVDKFSRYTDKLLTLQQQLDRLKYYNKKYWEGRLDDLLDHYTIWVSDHVQRIDDLEILHVEFDSVEETIEMWWRVFVGEQPKSWRWPELRLDAKHLRLLGSNVRTYQTGIHRVRINLVAHWKPEAGRTLLEVRAQAKQSGEILAHTEVMSAYGIHSELLREQDGENLPYADLPGTEVRVAGDGAWQFCLFVYWDPFSREAKLSADWTDDRRYYWSAPVLREY